MKVYVSTWDKKWKFPLTGRSMRFGRCIDQILVLLSARRRSRLAKDRNGFFPR